ncbi:MAG: PEGA domain-containing protein [Patescibacteria group bacterium]
MEYPGSKFTRRIRITTLLAFIAAFFIISPVVILYSAGYRFDFKNGLLLETGSLSVDILPLTATVYLDGLKIDQAMPIRLNNLTPHKYNLKISASGHYDWEKQIEISRNKTTYIKEFILLKKSKPKLITPDTAAGISISASGRYLAYSIFRNNETELVIEDEQKKNKNLIFRLSGALTLLWATHNDTLAVASGVGNGNRRRVSVIDVVTGNMTDVRSADPILKYLWGETANPNLYYGTKDGIYSFTPHSGQVSLITNSKFLDWQIDNEILWTMDINTSTAELMISKDTLGFRKVFNSFTTIGNEPTKTLANTKFETIEHDTVLLRDKAENIYYIVRANAKFAINASKYYLSRFNNWWLFWSPYELWTYSEDDEPYLLNRSGVKFENILPLDKYNTLALHRDGKISALFPFFYIERELVDDSVKVMTADPEARVIYYSNDKGIWKLNY